MSGVDNTLFLRLAGPMQSWGTASRFQLRRSDAYPSKSGVLGLLLCAMGVRREDSPRELARLTPMVMGVRVDRAGTMDWDYHTAGARIGVRAADGKIKKTGKTGEYETLLSRRQYLYDASFLVALHGHADVVESCARALDFPVWPVSLGRKCCVPAEPVFAGTGRFDTVAEALANVPWRSRIGGIDRADWSKTRRLVTFIEHLPGSPPPYGAHLVYDVPRCYGFYNYGPRWVVSGQVTAPVGDAEQCPWPEYYPRRPDYTSLQWQAARLSRLNLDQHLCVFCKSPAQEVHHVSYDAVGAETDSDLRSLCKTCHDACTMLEYGHAMGTLRIDPSDPANRDSILRQIDLLFSRPRRGRRRELLESVRLGGWEDTKDISDTYPGEVE